MSGSSGGGGNQSPAPAPAPVPAPAPEAWMDEFVTGMGAAMQRSKRPLKDLFRKFDANDDGMIDYNEFYKTLDDMQCPLTKDEMERVALFMDQDQDGMIDINEFAAGFHITSDSTTKDDPEHWESRVKHQLLRMFFHNKPSLMHIFHSYDELHLGVVSKEIFIQSMNALLAVTDDVRENYCLFTINYYYLIWY